MVLQFALPVLGAAGTALGSLLGLGITVGSAVAGTAASAALGVGKTVAGLGAKAVGGGARAIGGALGIGGKEQTAAQVTPTVTTTQPNNVKQQQQRAEKQQSTSIAKVTKQTTDSSRQAEKSSKNGIGILSGIRMQLEKLNDKVSGIVSAITSGQRAEGRAALEGKVEGARSDDIGSVQKTGIAERGKKLIKKTGGFISSILGLIFKFFVLKIGTMAFFPELEGAFNKFQTNVVDFFKNIFSAVVKLFKGDFEGSKEDALEAFGNLKDVLKDIAKFASGLVDKVLGVFGMEELNLFEEAEKKVKEIEDSLTKSLGGEAEGKGLLEKIMKKLELILMDALKTVVEFFNPFNLYDLYSRSKSIKNFNKVAVQDMENIIEEKGARGKRIKGARDKIVEDAVREFEIPKMSRPSFEKLKAKRGPDGKGLTPEEEAIFQRAVTAGEQQTQIEIDDAKRKDQLRRDSLGPTRFERKNEERLKEEELERQREEEARAGIQKLEKKDKTEDLEKLKDSAKFSAGGQLVIGSIGANQSQNVQNNSNAFASVGKGGGGGDIGTSANFETTFNRLASTYANIAK